MPDNSKAEKPPTQADQDQIGRYGRKREGRLLAFLLIVLFPMLTVALIGGFGLAVWLWQVFTGPPSIG